MTKNSKVSLNKNEPDVYCVNCNKKLLGSYCYNCGEKKFNREDYSVHNFFAHGVDVFTHFNFKVLKSFYLLITKPGFLTSELIKGRHVKYAKPFQVFFVINVLFFLLNFGFETFTTPLYEHVNSTFYKELAGKLINEEIIAEKISRDQFEVKFNDKISKMSKFFILVLIPQFALVFFILFRKQDAYYFDCLIFSTYFLSFILIFFTIVLNLIYYLIIKFTDYDFNFDTNPFISDWLSFLIATISLFTYLFISLKRVFGQNDKITFLKTAFSLTGIYLIIELYKFILFIAVYYTI